MKRVDVSLGATLIVALLITLFTSLSIPWGVLHYPSLLIILVGSGLAMGIRYLGQEISSGDITNPEASLKATGLWFTAPFYVGVVVAEAIGYFLILPVGIAMSWSFMPLTTVIVMNALMVILLFLKRCPIMKSLGFWCGVGIMGMVIGFYSYTNYQESGDQKLMHKLHQQLGPAYAESQLYIKSWDMDSFSDKPGHEVFRNRVDVIAYKSIYYTEEKVIYLDN
jgi:MFS family permease